MVRFAVAVALGIASLQEDARAAEEYHRLKASEIAARFSGMEFTDEVHWALVFERGGRLSSVSMGKASTDPGAREGRALPRSPTEGARCYEVWAACRRVQLRSNPPPGRGCSSEAAEAAVNRDEQAGANRSRRMRVLSAIVILGFVGGAPAFAAEAWQQEIASGLGKPGTEMPGGVYRVALPRTDLHVTLDGVEIKPALALGSWLAFEPMGNEVMVMGDLVLTADEVNPVLKRLEDGSVEVTALHNHLLRASPATMYMHVHGQGSPTKLATTLREALGASKTPFGAETAGISAGAAVREASTTASTGQPIDLDTDAIDQALGRKGKVNGGVYQVNVPRAEMPKTAAWTCQRPWDRRSPSTSSRPEPAKPPLPATSCSPLMRSTLSSGRCDQRHRGDGDLQSHAQR